MSRAAAAAALLSAMASAGVAQAGGKVTIKLGTLAPDGSVWHNVLSRMAERWRDETSGEVHVKIFPGGVAGDENDMVRKMRIGQLHAAAMTGVGLGAISKSAVALQIPMMFDSWEELDYVRERVAPELEADMAQKGFVVLHWGDAGWVHKFANVNAASAGDYRKLKLFIRAGDPDGEKLWRDAGFNPVPLSPSDVMASLRTGMIEAFGTTPLFALSSQWFGLAKNMLRINWTPLNGATVITKEAWSKVPAESRDKLLIIAREEGVSLRQDVRALNDKAVDAMVERGLRVIEPTPEVLKEWRDLAVKTYPHVRGTMVPERYFDQVQKLVAEYRAKPR